MGDNQQTQIQGIRLINPEIDLPSLFKGLTVPQDMTSEQVAFIYGIAYRTSLPVSASVSSQYDQNLIGQYSELVRGAFDYMMQRCAALEQKVYQLEARVQQLDHQPQSINISLPEMRPSFEINAPDVNTTINLPKKSDKISFQYDKYGNVISATPAED